MRFKDAYAKLYTHDERKIKGRELTFFIENTERGSVASICLTKRQVKAMRNQIDKFLSKNNHGGDRAN